ncbi:TAXI family TRAP transporter solute-binding subunit [Rhodomicrobium vannielii]|nr:hypothetical protein [Rhodomicrobium vannielii]
MTAHSASPSSAQTPKANAIDAYRNQLNENVVSVLGADLTGGYIKIVEDIAKAVNDGQKLRVLPIVGEGGSQNIRDILYLKGVDAGIVMSNSFDVYKKEALFEDLPNRLLYIARLYEEEVHIIASKDINKIEDLANKKVAFHGGAIVSGKLLFDKLGVKPSEISQVNFFQGLEKIKTGELSAIVRATASPMEQFEASFDPNFHKLITVPFDTRLIDSFLPSKLTSKQYPKILGEGESIDTPAIGVVLAAYAWKPGTDRYRRLELFINAFFSNIDKIIKNPKRHPKWDDVNLAATLPGWKRFPAAEAWLKRNRPATTADPKSDLQRNFTSYLEKRGVRDAQQDELFLEFQKWRQSGGR